jgi:very-short-patch-repair endonuclease
MSTEMIDLRLRTGRWQTVHRGVYSVFTGQVSRPAVLWAAVRRAGSGAALSHQTAAELFRLTDQPSALIHVTIPEIRRVGKIVGVVIHRSGRIADAVHPSLQPQRTRIEETVLDLVDAAGSFDAAFGMACAACQRRLTTSAHISEAMTRRGKLRWRDELTRALDQIGSGAHSLLEYRYLHRVERPHGLPAADRQARQSHNGRNRYLDNLYRDFGLCVELDGQQAHPDDQRWSDLRRINDITEHGLTILRYGWTDVDRRSCHVAAQVAAVLRNLGWLGQARPCGRACAVRLSPPSPALARSPTSRPDQSRPQPVAPVISPPR